MVKDKFGQLILKAIWQKFDPTPARIAKLKVMLANPPADPMLSHNHVSIAWVSDLLKDSNGKYLGFLMPTIADSKQLSSIYNPRRRKKVAPGFNWYYLHVTALNTAWIIQEIHAKGYVLGDIKLENILVNDRAMTAVIDTDSFQVRDSQSDRVYRCTVGSEGFTPPELLGKDFDTTNQTEIHDRFRLGVLIHYLLFGYHPFSGNWTGVGESPEQTELIKQGYWYGGHNSPIHASKTTIPLDVVHPELKKLFLKCFNQGHTQPNLRPTAQNWHNALEVAVNQLTVCSRVDSHHYSKTYGTCCWCDRAATLGVDIFPGVARKAKILLAATQTIPVSKSSSQSSKQLNSSSPHTLAKPTSNNSPPPRQVLTNLASVPQSTTKPATSGKFKFSFKKKLLAGGTGAILFLLSVTQIYGFSKYELSPFSQIFLITSLRSKILLKYTLKGIASPVAITPDGKTLVTGEKNDDGNFKVWNLETKKLKYSIETDYNSTSGTTSPWFAISPDGKTLVSRGKVNDGILKVWNLQTGKPIYNLTGHNNISDIAISPDGTRIVSGSWDETVTIWNLQTRTVNNLTDHDEWIVSVVITPDGKTVVSADFYTIKIWDLDTGRLKRTFKITDSGNSIDSLAISPDGQTLVSGLAYGHIKIWDLDTGKLKHNLIGHTREVRSLAISPDGQILVSGDQGLRGSENKSATIKIWDLDTGKLKHTLIGGFTTGIDSLAISPDGQTLVSSGLVGSSSDWNRSASVKIWRMP